MLVKFQENIKGVSSYSNLGLSLLGKITARGLMCIHITNFFTYCCFFQMKGTFNCLKGKLMMMEE